MANYYNYTITRTWRATDVSGNFSESAQTITVQDVTKPTISTVANAIINCQDDHSSTATGKATGTDICSPVTITQSDVSTQGTNASMANYYNYTITRTWRATDVSGNFSESVQTITVQDVTKPLNICPIVANNKNTDAGLCTYSVVENEYNATASDNCSLQSLTYVLSGATTGTGSTLRGVKLYRGTTTVTWTAKDATGNTTICSFNVTVNDDQNPTSYIIYAKNEVKFGEYNFINGDIGVTAANGKASFKKYDVLNPYFVKAKNIDVVLPAEVTNRISIPATGGPNPVFYSYNGNTASLNNYNVSGDMILSGNFKDLNIKKGIIVTIQGNNFGKISIEEGAQVTFSSSVLNIENLDIKAGKKGSITTGVFFSQPTTVKIKDKVSVDNDSRINVGGPKVTFYLSDAKGDEEIFTVKGENTQVTANIIMPNGKLKVQGGDSRACIMTGWYIIDKLESTGKYITWNAYDCSMSKPALYKTNGKIFSNISAYMEEKRNAIPFMTNQGLETESWIAEKRNNITGEFEKLEMRNLNTDIKTALQSHTFYDNTPTEGDNFYRVKMMYANGNVVYSDIKKINNSKFNDFTVYPNPTNKDAWVDLKSFEDQQVTLVLSDMTGKTLHQQVIEKVGIAPIHLDITNLQTGLYMVKIQAQGNRVMVRKIQIAK